MESTENEIITHVTDIEETGVTSVEYWFKTNDMPVIFWTKEPHGLKPGDRVKITITKEPTNAR